MDDDLTLLSIGGLVGLLVGVLGGMGLMATMSNSHEAKIFRDNEKPSVIRLYNSGRDGILVEGQGDENEDKYITLSSYLRKYFIHEADKDIEEERIKQQVEWYK